MLLEMRFNKFFSIKDEICIDFKAGNINTVSAKELADNLLSVNDEILLKVQGVFDPNASDKSSILKAAYSADKLSLILSKIMKAYFSITFLLSSMDILLNLVHVTLTLLLMELNTNTFLQSQETKLSLKSSIIILKKEK
ncbi:hypothetical protein [Treponema pectinovorum]|uniref:hypothetical protein n=1 Tax=Treponema pectinovorum TaxID=164 RepID=UPI0011F20A75|nr:hypothetical protein [Treponema pectinovorum]